MTTSARLLAPLLLALSCGGDPSYDHASTASTILVADGSLWLTSPDDDAVVVLDLETLDQEARFLIAGGPERLLHASDGRLWVSLPLAAAVACIDGDTVSRHPVPCGGTHDLAERPDGRIAVSCPHDDRMRTPR